MERRSEQSRAAAMITITNDWADHYSTAAKLPQAERHSPPDGAAKEVAPFVPYPRGNPPLG